MDYLDDFPYIFNFDFSLQKAFECELCELRPSSIRCPAGTWTVEAKTVLENLIRRSDKAFGKVVSLFSVWLKVKKETEQNIVRD